jgi:hypothetical protein
MNCQIVFLDNVDEIQNLGTDGYRIKVPRVKKTLGSIFDELASFLNQSSKEQRDNYATIYIYDDNDYYYLIAIDKLKQEKYYSMSDAVYNTIMKNLEFIGGQNK